MKQFLSMLQSDSIKSFHYHFLLYGCFFLLGNLCHIIFCYTHHEKEYVLQNCRGFLRIYFKDHEITVRALVDTGNCLYEPETNKPVCLVEYGVVRKLFNPGEKPESYFLIPYQSIGMPCGVLLGIEADKLVFYDRKKRYIKQGCVIGIYQGTFSSFDFVQAIVHPDVLKK